LNNCYSIKSPSSLKLIPRSIKQLNLNWLDLGNDPLKDLPKSLTHLNLYGYKSLNDEGLKYFPTSLIQLDLIGTSISNDGIKYLPTTLQLLVLPETITDIGLKLIHSNLQYLHIFWCKKITEEGIKSLSNNLKKIQVDNNMKRIIENCRKDLLSKLGHAHISWD